MARQRNHHFCVSALERALMRTQPEIFNSDQGAQFMSLAFTEPLLARGIRISMDGRGRVFDNIVVERLWPSMKNEEIYIKGYRSVREAIHGLWRYFEFYNRERLHQSLNYQTPAAVYRQGQKRAAVAPNRLLDGRPLQWVPTLPMRSQCRWRQRLHEGQPSGALRVIHAIVRGIPVSHTSTPAGERATDHPPDRPIQPRADPEACRRWDRMVCRRSSGIHTVSMRFSQQGVWTVAQLAYGRLVSL